MKKTSFFLVAAMFVALMANGQTQSEDAQQGISEAEKFSNQSGRLIETEFKQLGKLKTMVISLVQYKDLINEGTRKAIRFEYVSFSDMNNVKIAVLDIDEIEALIKALNILKSKSGEKRSSYTEIVFRSRSGFEASGYYDDKKEKWGYLIRLKRFDRNSLMSMDLENIDTLIKLLETAK